MKKFSAFLAKATMIFLMLATISCSKDDDNLNGSGSSVPDPEGTRTYNIGRYEALKIFERFYIQWDYPNNLIASTSSDPYYGYYLEDAIYDIGEVPGLGSITKHPNLGSSGWTTINGCEVGHGYVIRCTNGKYIRLYVAELITSTHYTNYGAIVGAKLRYQYPFEPK